MKRKFIESVIALACFSCCVPAIVKYYGIITEDISIKQTLTSCLNSDMAAPEIETASIEENNLELTAQAMQDRYYCQEPEILPILDESEVELLAHLLMAECGSDYCTDDLIYYVGSVVLNRVNSEKFPDTLEDVIYQHGQYQCVSNGAIYKQPTDRCYDIATDLLIHGSYLPDEILYQAEFVQAKGIYLKEQNMYFCY